MLKLGISGQALGDTMPFDQIVDIGKKYGVLDFELWPVNAIGSGSGYDGRDVDTVERTVKEKGIRICCVTYNDAFNKEIVGQSDVYVKGLCSAIRTAARLGAPCVNHYCYYIAKDHLDFDRMEQYWTKPLLLAEQLGVRLALENEAHDATGTPQGMQKVLDHFDSPWFLTNLDATNYFHASCEGFPMAYDLLKDKIGYVHLKNACLYREGLPAHSTGAPMSGHYAPMPIQYASIEDGCVNIAGLLRRLQNDGLYNGACTLEPHTQPQYVEPFYACETTALRKLGFFQ